MRKFLTAAVVVTLVGLSALATAGPADAWGRWGWGWRGRYWGPGPVVAGAVVGGAVVGAAVAAPYYNRGYYPYGYYGGCRNVWNGYAWVRACY
jgi:hypothetical protein